MKNSSSTKVVFRRLSSDGQDGDESGCSLQWREGQLLHRLASPTPGVGGCCSPYCEPELSGIDAVPLPWDKLDQHAGPGLGYSPLYCGTRGRRTGGLGGRTNAAQEGAGNSRDGGGG